MAGQIRIPYADGMTEGQGYNSYLQQTCVHDAVTVEATDGPDTPMELIYQSSEIKDYNELLQTLDISAGAGVAGWGTDTKIDSKFLDRTEIKKSLLTYVVKVDAQRQPSARAKYTFNWTSPANPQGKYGDRFISDFIKGGALFARVSIITNEKSTSHELQVAAKTAFTVYGANTEVTTEVKESIDKIQKSSEVKIYLHYVGAPAKMQSKDGAENNMMRLKELADAFYSDAPKHTYKRFALLEKYTNIPNFHGAFQPLDYTEAKDRSWAVFNDFTECLDIREMLRAIDSNHYTNGRTDRENLDNKVSTQLQLYRTWVDGVSKNPKEAESPPSSDFPIKLQTEVLLAVKRRKYFAQSIRLSNNLRTHFIDDHKHATAKELFSFEAYDFGQIMGTTKIIFGRRTNGDKYICLMGRPFITPGYTQMSQLWGFEEKAKDVVDGEVVMDPIFEMGIVRLELQDAMPRRDDDLSFYVKRV
ncbi:hypothetical protein PG993_002272 [Apiospora rasikravindrae]|uniref:Uncharacterized protein n=1 Tax=Apiospora rasikravindrae TaxID=990691 RepID=A0ABR1TWK6_9PEZI